MVLDEAIVMLLPSVPAFPATSLTSMIDKSPGLVGMFTVLFAIVIPVQRTPVLDCVTLNTVPLENVTWLARPPPPPNPAICAVVKYSVVAAWPLLAATPITATSSFPTGPLTEEPLARPRMNMREFP